MTKRQILITYQRHSSLNDTSCFYCGAHGESQDHVPAISHAYNYPHYERLLVRSCLLCNSLLGARFLPTLFERVSFLLSKFRSKFKKIISMPHWSQDEIGELSGRLKRTVILGMKKKKDVNLRINRLQSLTEALMPEGITSDVVSDTES